MAVKLAVNVSAGRRRANTLRLGQWLGIGPGWRSRHQWDRIPRARGAVSAVGNDWRREERRLRARSGSRFESSRRPSIFRPGRLRESRYDSLAGRSYCPLPVSWIVTDEFDALDVMVDVPVTIPAGIVQL